MLLSYKTIQTLRTKTSFVLAVVIISLLFLTLNFMGSPYTPDRNSVSSINLQEITTYKDIEKVTDNKEKLKYILQWTLPYTIPFQYWGKGQDTFKKRNCSFQNCFVTNDRNFLNSVADFDAIAFHGPEIVRENIKDPDCRSPHQKYVFVSIESSHNYPLCKKRYNGFFNWTWTYKLNSDEPYGYITVRNENGEIIGPKTNMHWMDTTSMKPINEELKEKLKSKSKTAAWIVSNCKALSKRHIFVSELRKELQKYGLDIDIYGGCGKLKCPVEKMDECLKMIEKDYYFYLALENSFSEDYVTEKLLSGLEHYAVPVVFGGANYTRFMPDGIYLHGGKLKPKDLAKEMSDIINDKDKYYDFFKWRNHYSYHAREEAPDTDDHCRMCAMLNDKALMTKETVYEDFIQWWNVPGKCK